MPRQTVENIGGQEITFFGDQSIHFDEQNEGYVDAKSIDDGGQQTHDASSIDYVQYYDERRSPGLDTPSSQPGSTRVEAKPLKRHNLRKTTAAVVVGCAAIGGVSYSVGHVVGEDTTYGTVADKMPGEQPSLSWSDKIEHLGDSIHQRTIGSYMKGDKDE